MSNDIEALKTNKIQSGPTLLPIIAPEGSSPEPMEVEHYGGSGIAPAGPIDKEAMQQYVVAAIKCVYDPEIPVNIYDLGLIYGIEVSDDAKIEVQMTLTAPGCPVADTLVREVAERAGAVPGVQQSHVTLVWDPPWSKDRMSEEALLELGLL